jgi:hypothetical protein
MDKDKPKRRSSGTTKTGADVAPVPKAVKDDDQPVRGAPVTLHPLAFRDALRVLVDTAPPNKRYKTDAPPYQPPLKSPPKKRGK